MINSVSSAADTKGSENIIDGEITITEKLDVFRFVFEKTNEGVNFYKKDFTPINIIERTLTDMWEDAIYDIKECVKNVDIPVGYQFGISYTPVDRPLRIPYPTLPKYILSDVSYKNKRNKKFLSDEMVTEWAYKLGLGTPPIIFKGVLDEMQKNILINYDKRDFESIKEVNFSTMVEKLIGKTYSQGQILEGIVISNGGQPLQIESHEFNLLKESYNKMRPNKVLYDMVLIHMSKYLNESKIDENSIGDYKYLNTVCNIFNDFIENNTIVDSISESDLSPIHYGHSGKLNKTWIDNDVTLSYINSNSIYESLFKIFLNALRKPKKTSNILNENVVEIINNFVKTLSESCYACIDEEHSNNILVDEISKQRNDGDIDSMRVISSIQRAFNSTSVDIPKGAESVILFISNYSPISVSEYVLMEQLHAQYNLNIVLCHYNTYNSLSSDDYIISDNLVNAQMKSLVENVPFIIDAIKLDKDSLTEIFQKCRPKYEPMLMCCTNNSGSDYKNQLYFNEQVNGGKIGVMDNFDIIEQPNLDNIHILQTIESENAIEFKNWTPKCVHWLWNNIVGEYKIWLGSILNNNLRNEKIRI